MVELDKYSYDYEGMLWQPELFNLYQDPPIISDEELLIGIYRRFNENKQKTLEKFGYIKDIKIRSGYTFTYINKYGINVKQLYDLIKCDEILVEPNHTIVFKYKSPWSPNSLIDNLDDADIYWSRQDEKRKKDLIDITKLSNNLLMILICGDYIIQSKEEECYYGYIKDIRINSIYTFEYLRRNRISEKEYYLEPLYEEFSFIRKKTPIPKFKIIVEPNFTLLISYEDASL